MLGPLGDARGGALSRELRLLQEAHRRARAAELEVARLTQHLAQREHDGWCVAAAERGALAGTVARLERLLEAERQAAAREVAAHDRDRRIAQRQLRVAEGALHRAARDGWLGAEDAAAALEELAAIAAQERDLARHG